MSSVFTIGHSNGSIEDFLSLLKRYDVQVVVDVRSSPSSGYTPHFGRQQLERYLARTGIRYLFLGRELGGRPEAAEFYDADGYVRYDLVAASPPFQEGIRRLMKGSAQFRIAIMCGEEDPVSCHRRRLVGRALMDQGLTVAHIRHSGAVESEQDVAIREALKYPALMQLAWTGSASWRSAHPVRDRNERRQTA